MPKLIAKNLNDMREKLVGVSSAEGKECRDLIEKCQSINIKSDGKLTIEQAAKMLSVSPQTIRNWEADGTLTPCERTKGGHRRYLESEVVSLRKKQLSGLEIILPDVTPAKLRALGEHLLQSFAPNEKVSLIISQNDADQKVRITIDSEDGLMSVCKTFTMED